MALPWAAQAAQNKLAVREGLKIVRKVIARDGTGSGLTTTELYKLALKEPSPPNFVVTSKSSDDDVSPQTEIKYGRTGRRRIPPPTPPHPRHPIQSISFLKHHLLPHVQGERLVRHLREKRLVVQPTADVKPRPLRSGAKSKPAVATSAATAEPIETTVWLWRATRPPKPKQKAPVPRPPIVYDYSHMKASKRKAHKARDELNAKRAMLRGRREKLEGDAKRKAERERQAVLKAEGRIRHQQAEEASRIEKERKRKEWEEKNPILARTLTKQREKAATLGKAPLAPGQLPTPSPRLHA